MLKNMWVEVQEGAGVNWIVNPFYQTICKE